MALVGKRVFIANLNTNHCTGVETYSTIYNCNTCGISTENICAIEGTVEVVPSGFTDCNICSLPLLKFWVCDDIINRVQKLVQK